MLRVTCGLSLATWTSLFVGLAWALRQSGAFVYCLALAIAIFAIALSAMMLLRNRPLLLGPMFIVSVLGLLPGLWGLGLLLFCVGATFGSSLRPAMATEWFFAVALTLMLVPPINWAILWRDHRHEIASKI
jgi:hypothetical protein